MRQIWLPGKMKILLILSVLLAGTGILFLYWYDQAQQACDQISDQCADAGFAWEASGKLLVIAASPVSYTHLTLPTTSTV